MKAIQIFRWIADWKTFFDWKYPLFVLCIGPIWKVWPKTFYDFLRCRPLPVNNWQPIDRPTVRCNFNLFWDIWLTVSRQITSDCFHLPCRPHERPNGTVQYIFNGISFHCHFTWYFYCRTERDGACCGIKFAQFPIEYFQWSLSLSRCVFFQRKHGKTIVNI